jgi:divalent metal cation (Fe/Co/Zn/Cd) transporter
MTGSDVGRETAPRDWPRIARSLVFATLAYNVVEAAIALWAGAEASSIALLGFGLDSVIECAAAAVLRWRLTPRVSADAERLEATERTAHRFIGATFIALATYVALQASTTLWSRHAPQESLLGIVLACVSLLLMPPLAWGKLRAAQRVGSAALRAEAKETLACCYLSLTLLLGLAANAAAGWWWADPLAALLMLPWLLHEGAEGLRGDAD